VVTVSVTVLLVAPATAPVPALELELVLVLASDAVADPPLAPPPQAMTVLASHASTHQCSPLLLGRPEK
jgi:hypothetical protein